ncbi:MAG: hypothetical protein MJ183_06415 [Treponemataceae bacterium]|nr:hypothetical protein [Treponemataceae bacterium]
MKKILKITAIAAFAVLSLTVTSCNWGKPKNPGTPKNIDFRNKDSSGKVVPFRSTAPENPEFNKKFVADIPEFDRHSFYKVTKEINGSIYNEAEFDVVSSKEELEAFADNVKITSDDDGFQLEFAAPEGFAEVDFWSLAYVDGNGYNSTCITKDDAPGALKDGKLTVVYPLVIKGESAYFHVQFASTGITDTKHWEAQLYFSVKPENGLGCVEDLPLAFNPADYLEIVDGHVLKISKMIPPMAKNLTHSFILNEQDKGTKPYGEVDDYAVVNSLGCVIGEEASVLETDACAEEKAIEFTIDLNDYTEYSDAYVGRVGSNANMDYIWAMFHWSYSLDKFPGYTFSTPSLVSNVVPNTVFRTENQ